MSQCNLEFLHVTVYTVMENKSACGDWHVKLWDHLSALRSFHIIKLLKQRGDLLTWTLFFSHIIYQWVEYVKIAAWFFSTYVQIKWIRHSLLLWASYNESKMIKEKIWAWPVDWNHIQESNYYHYPLWIRHSICIWEKGQKAWIFNF